MSTWMSEICVWSNRVTSEKKTGSYNLLKVAMQDQMQYVNFFNEANILRMK